jgi:UDP-N-acetylglucosamine 1-carboxyvinyltransferase
VGATENLLFAGVLADGRTTIVNAAREPEIVDLVSQLTAMGASIDGAGTSLITIDGVAELHPAEHAIIPD